MAGPPTVSTVASSSSAWVTEAGAAQLVLGPGPGDRQVERRRDQPSTASPASPAATSRAHPRFPPVAPAWRRPPTESAANSTAPARRLRPPRRRIEPLVPRVPARTKAAPNEPRMEPPVLAAYSRPTLPPAASADGVPAGRRAGRRSPSGSSPAGARPRCGPGTGRGRPSRCRARPLPGRGPRPRPGTGPGCRAARPRPGEAPVQDVAEGDAEQEDGQDGGEDVDAGAGALGQHPSRAPRGRGDEAGDEGRGQHGPRRGRNSRGTWGLAGRSRRAAVAPAVPARSQRRDSSRRRARPRG